MSPMVVTLILLAFVIAAFITGKIPNTVISVIVLATIILSGTLKPAEALAGFTNSSVIVFAGMFVVSAGIKKTGVLEALTNAIKRQRKSQTFMLFGILLISFVICNITSGVGAVAILIPLVIELADECGVSRSKWVYPVMAVSSLTTGAFSFLSQGALTMTNGEKIVAAGLAEKGWGFWDVTVSKIPIIIIALVYFTLLAPKLLPDNPPEAFADYKPVKSNVSTAEAVPPKTRKVSAIICTVSLVLMILSDFIHVPLYIITLCGAAALILFGVVGEQEAFNSIRWQSVAIVVSMLALAQAMASSGAGAYVGDFVKILLGGIRSPYVLTFVFFFACMLLTQVMSNIGALAIFVNIALSFGMSININPTALVFAVINAATTCLLTPIASPAASIVFEPGAYTFKDYMKCGLPCALIAAVVQAFWLPIMFPLV